jgi:AraC-like DNA-binding protein
MLTYGLKPGLIMIFLIVSLFSLLTGPLILFYTRAYIARNRKFRQTDLLHFIPFLLILIYVLIRTYVFHDQILWHSNIRKSGNVIMLASLLIYLILTLKEIKDRIGLKKFISLLKRDYIFGHVAFFILAFTFIWIAKLHVFLILDVWNRYGFCPYMYSIYFSTAFVIINASMFLNLISPNHKNRRSAPAYIADSEKASEYREILNREFTGSEIYKDPEITLSKLSEATGIPYSYLSDFINREYQLTFRELINKYRAEKAAFLISADHDKKRTFLEIAYEAGFNSKSTFNLAFKKYFGMSPSDYSNAKKKSS